MSGANLAEYKSEQKKGVLAGVIPLFIVLWFYRRVALNLLYNQLTVRYQDSTLGVLWAVLSPLFMMVAIAIIFPLIMRVSMENYVVYLFAGLMFWRVISNVITTGGTSIISDQSLVRQTALPSILYPIVTVMAEFVNFLIVLITIYFVGLMFDFEVSLKIFYLLASLLISFVFCIGLASITSILIVFFHDLKHVLEVLVQSLFYLTPIIYPLSFLPESFAGYMNWNPFYHFVRLFHEAIYHQGSGDWSLFLYPLGIAWSVLILGVLLHCKFGRSVVFRL